VKDLYYTYKDEGLVIIAVHTPEFSYEKDLDNVKEALVRLDVPFPVAIDNDWKTWRAYHNRYWPAQYLIDKAGNIRDLKIGEVHVGTERYEDYKAAIEALLAEDTS